MFIAPGVFAQVQPKFIHARMLFEAREGPSKMFHWLPFVLGEIIGELPYMLFCGVIYFVVWCVPSLSLVFLAGPAAPGLTSPPSFSPLRYFIVFPIGISTNPQHAGPMLALMLLYQFWTVGFAYAVAACVQNEQQAALINPIVRSFRPPAQPAPC